MKQLFTLLALGATMNAGAQCASSSNIYSFTYNGKSYEVIKEMKTWAQAASCALQRGGHLVHIDDVNENTAVYNAITTGAGVASNYTSVNDGGGAAYVWIGATDKKTEGAWLWDGDDDGTGTNFWNGEGGAGSGGGSAVNNAYVNWGGVSKGAIKEPDDYNNNQDAAGMALSNWPYGIPGEWNDIAITNTLYYVVEFENTGMQQQQQQQFLELYPNPCTGKLNLHLNATELQNAEAKIYNLQGQLILSAKMNANTLDVSGLTEGSYLLEINTSKENYRTRFVKL